MEHFRVVGTHDNSQLAIDIFTRLARLVFAHRSEHNSERMGAVNKPAKHANVPSTPPGHPSPLLARPRTTRPILVAPCAHMLLPRCVRSMPYPPQPAKRKACSLRSGARNRNHVAVRLHAKARRRFPSNRGPQSGRPDGAVCDSRHALTKHTRPEGRHSRQREHEPKGTGRRTQLCPRSPSLPIRLGPPRRRPCSQCRHRSQAEALMSRERCCGDL